MSEVGDVVWSDGQTWQKEDAPMYKDKQYWYSPKSNGTYVSLKSLKALKDFRWLVKDGEVTPNYDDAVKEYEEVISTLEAELASKNDAFITAIALWKDEEVGWKQETDSLRQRIQKQRESIDAYQNEKEKCCVYNNCYEVEVIRDELKRVAGERDKAQSELAVMTEMRDAARKDAQEAVAGHEKLVEYYAADFPRRMSNNKELRELRKTCSDLGEENEQLSAALNDEKRLGRQEERKVIVTWLSSQYRTANGSFTHAIAEEIRNGKHLAGDDDE